MYKGLSFLNMKGGVGKTTVAAGDLPINRIRQVVGNVHMMESGTGESFRELARFITRGPNRQ